MYWVNYVLGQIMTMSGFGIRNIGSNSMNRYLSDLSSLSEGISGGRGESVTSNTSNRVRSTRGEKVRIKFHRCMELFLVEGGSCSYDDESIGGRRGSLEVQTSSETMGTQ
jgi:hypothetical protein